MATGFYLAQGIKPPAEAAFPEGRKTNSCLATPLPVRATQSPVVNMPVPTTSPGVFAAISCTTALWPEPCTVPVPARVRRILYRQ